MYMSPSPLLYCGCSSAGPRLSSFLMIAFVVPSMTVTKPSPLLAT